MTHEWINYTSKDFCDGSKPLPQTAIVVQFAPKVPDETIRWFVGKVKSNRNEGGGELIVMLQPCKRDEGITFHVTASKMKFLEIAEDMEIMKEDKYGTCREFTVSHLEDFMHEGMGVDDLFTMAERQAMVRHELDSIRSLSEESHVPGFKSAFKLQEGQSIVQALKRYQIVTKVFPLHDQEALKKLGLKWYWSIFGRQPLEEIRLYFGESIALYSTFIGFYTVALVMPTLLGILQMFVTNETLPFFCAFNVVWVTVFLELWKRRSNELAFKWGTIGMTSMDEPRPQFRGALGYDAVTGKLQPQSPRYETYVKMYAVSLPLVCVCMIAAFYIMLVSFWAEDYIKQCDEYYQQFILVPSVVYSIIILVATAYFRKLATFLTEWENHRTESQYERHRVTKLVLFEFVNNFVCLFYIAFIMQDIENLRSQLKTMLVVTQGLVNVQEAFLPLIMQYSSAKVKEITVTKKRTSTATAESDNKLLSDLKIPKIPSDDPRVQQALEEAEMDEYEDTYDDYLELFIEFGYVFLFSSVYPIAAFWAILNNVVEIRADAFKLCRVFQRPMSRKVKDIGAWQRAFEVLGGISIVTNCGVLYMSPKMREIAPSLSDVQWLLFFVFLEHILLGLRYLLHITISDKPEWVRVALAKRSYNAKQALKKERNQGSAAVLKRKFKTFDATH